MYYVYVLRSAKNIRKIYVGVTTNPDKRLLTHNLGMEKATKPYAPWEIELYIAVKKRETAFKFEKYLKSGSGKAFLKEIVGLRGHCPPKPPDQLGQTDKAQEGT